MAEKKIKLSRWMGPDKRKACDLAGLRVPPRYTESEFNHILAHYREGLGWHKGARVRRAA